MKITKLLKVVLVAPEYIVVDNGGENMRVSTNKSYAIGDIYEYEVVTQTPAYSYEESTTTLEKIEENKETTFTQEESTISHYGQEEG